MIERPRWAGSAFLASVMAWPLRSGCFSQTTLPVYAAPLFAIATLESAASVSQVPTMASLDAYARADVEAAHSASKMAVIDRAKLMRSPRIRELSVSAE
jgi:hypothetical protein